MAPSEDVSEKMEEGITDNVDTDETKLQEDAKKDQTDNGGDGDANETFPSTITSSAPEQDEEDETTAPTETSIATTPAPSSVATSNTPTADGDDDDDDMEEEATPPKFYVTQRVYGRDEPTGLLYEAVVRRIMRGPRSRQINVHLLSKEEAERLQENNTKHKNAEGGAAAAASSSADVDLGFVLDDFDERKESAQCWHYFVHYMGWNVKWDRWVEEDSLYEDSPGTKILADKLKAEMRKMKEKRKGKAKKKMKEEEVVALRRRMRQLEEERREEERKEQLAQSRGETEKDGDGKSEDGADVDEKDKDRSETNGNPKDGDGESVEKSSEGGGEDSNEQTAESSSKPEKDTEDTKKSDNTNKKTKEKKLGPMRMSKKAIEREIGLRKRDLESRRNQAYAEKIVLPFTLKKVMVEEWEIISQCAMVPNLPASVTVRDALNLYLESKIDMLRLKEKGSVDENEGEDQQNVDRGQKEEKEAESEEENSLKDKIDIDEKQEWVDMVEGLSLYFDQSLLTRLLFRQELRQHAALVRSSSKDPTLSDKRMSEIYGCEHLLRLFVRLPALIAESSLPEMETRKIYAKIGDLVRFMQKHQARFFTQSYRKPRHNEIMIKQDVGRGRKRASAGKNGNEDKMKTRVKKRVAAPSSDKDTEESDGSLSESTEQVRDDTVGKKQIDKKTKSLQKSATIDGCMMGGSKRRYKRDTSANEPEELDEASHGKKVSGGVSSTRTIDRRRTKRARTTKDLTSIEVANEMPKTADDVGETNTSKRHHKKESNTSDSTEMDGEVHGKGKPAGVGSTRTSNRQRTKKALAAIDVATDANKRTRQATKTSAKVSKREIPRRKSRR